ncbi:NADPH:quinone reductase-like Zn-dependent oxidoreductase [Microcella putealis]|uniref:NADPH:quinone reductase-like Zn-dependent oxidoreductase n=1 Tax=Microcella putealis TaxID=337005 RepID=A0A4Q7LWN3_9MICO|nr:NAD(P)-dependent alcohol dehydrogenase [Microcella putealis]RZS59396.1 NADPH:quinone reductase-like Zn-dependent oxidoreductase [Microcella putealis]TQM20021.1 NADPH:quinone reductase-like Zn-dependent oxidoreductase [Microcella putealis]
MTTTSSPSTLPTTMRALEQHGYGQAKAVLHERTRPVPTPGRGQVLVRVEAVSPDSGTIHLMTGSPRMVRPVIGLRTPRQPVPGLALAGRVVALGAGVTGISLGDRVAGTASGAFAEYAVASATKLAIIPDGVSMTDAAAAPVSYATALQTVQDAARVQPGQRVLVIGAGGGVGAAVVQFAKRAGAEVTAVASARKRAFVEGLGVARFIDYRVESTPAAWGTFDVVIDMADGRPLHVLRRALTPRGTLVIVGADGVGGPILEGFDRQMRLPLVKLFVSQRLVAVVQKEIGDTVSSVLEALANGSFRSTVTSIRPFAEATSAIDAIAAKDIAGKVVVTVP